jgi:predicted permease
MHDSLVRVLILVVGGLITVLGTGRFIGWYLSRFDDELEKSTGLKEGGRLIGLTERALIFAFIWTGVPTAIGLLITAKSILRFGDVTDAERRKHAEYVIIGTLMSFAIAVPLAFACRWLAFDVL